MSELLVSALADAGIQILSAVLRRLIHLLRRLLCPKLQKADERIPDEDLFE